MSQSGETKPRRVAIPTAVREKVLAVYDHRCSICGEHKPHIHHIDEDRANNDEMNLLPLCPNCHLTDIHDPTARIDQQKLQLFRRYRDPSILAPQFEPIFRRLRFILIPEVIAGFNDALRYANDLRDFVAGFEHGGYYAKRLEALVVIPHPRARSLTTDGVDDRSDHGIALQYRSHLDENRDEVLRLIVEMLRYQSWRESTPKRGRG